MESPSICRPMSPIRDVSVEKSQDPAKEIPAKEKDSKCPSPNEQTQTEVVTPIKEIGNQPSASVSIKPNNQSEIDTIQKHVEDSLLFLDYGKDSKETKNAPENVEENIDKTVHTDSLKEVVWENPEQVENKTEDLDKMDGIQAICDKSSSLDETQNETNVVSDYGSVHLEASNIASTDESMNKTSISVEKVPIMTEISEKIYDDVKNNVLLEQSQIEENIEHEINSPGKVNNNVPIQDIIWETPLSVEQARKEIEAPESMGEDIALIQNTSDEGLALNDAPKTSVVSEQIYASVDSNVQEPSQISHLLENRKEVSVKGSPPLDISIKETDNVLTKNDALSESQHVSVQESFLENQISSKHVKENVPGNTNNKVLEPLVKDITDIPILESFKDSKSHENVDDNVQPSEIAPVKASIQESSIPSAHEIKDLENMIENVDDKVCLEPSQTAPMQNNYEETPMLSEHEKEIASKQKPVKASIQESPIPSAHVIKNLENMVEKVDSEVCLEPSQTVPMQNNYEETPMLSEDEKEIASKQKVVWESVVISDNTTETVEKVVEDVNKVDLDSLQIADQQEHVEVTTTTSELENRMKDPEMIDENTDNNVSMTPSEIDVTQENIEDGAVSSENNLNPKILNTSTDKNVNGSSETDMTQENVEDSAVSSENNLNPKIFNTKIDVNLEETQIVPKQKSLWKSPISIEQIQKEPERNIENVIYHSRSAHSGALKAVPIQEQEQKRTEKPVENINSLKVIPIQDSVTETAITPQKNYENLTYNTHSAHSGSLKVVPIHDHNEHPPAKRARIETRWIPNKNTDNSHSLTMPSNAVPAQEIVHESTASTHALKNVFCDDSVAGCSAMSEVSSAQCDTTNKPASNRPQSSCSSIIEDTPMDIDSDNGDTTVPTGDSADAGPKFVIKDLNGFISWCKTNGIFDLDSNNCLPRYANVVKYSQHNKGVLRLAKLPGYFNRNDIRQLITKQTDCVDKDIAKNITFIYIDKTSCPLFKTALIKWRDQDMLNTVKAFLLLKKANLFFDGVKLRPSYDTRQKVDWVNEKPITKKNYHKHWERNQSPLGAPSVVSAASAPKPTNIKPFLNGQVDFNDPVLFGLNQEFVALLNVKLPLTTDIFIKNLDIEQDEEKLRRVFSAAGIIRDLRKYPNPDGNSLNLRIQYDHPLEAIQAISMFDQVVLHDRTITVSMTKGKVMDVLPDGFHAIGPGLCLSGKPMRNIRTHIEIAKVKSNCDKEMDKLKHKIAVISNKLRSMKSHQIRIEQQQDTAAEAASQQNTQNAMPVQQEPPNTMASLHQNAATALQQNPQNTMAALSTAIASSIQNNILGMLGMQPNTLQGFVQHSPNTSAAPNWSTPNTDISWTQPTQSNFSADMQNQHGQSYPLSGFANVQTASNMQSAPNMQYAPNMQSAPNMQTAANVKPSAVNMELNHNLQAGVQNQTTYGNMQHGFAPFYSMQPEPSNMPVQYPQSSIAQSDFSNEPQLNTGMYPPLPAPVGSNPGAYDAYKQTPVSRFDIPPIIVKPQNRGQNLPAVQTVMPGKSPQLDIPLPIVKPQKRGASVKTAFKIKNPNLTPVPVTKTLKSGGIKFNIPSLQTPAKLVPEEIEFAEVLSAAKTQEKAFSQAQQPAYSKAVSSAKRKSPDAEPWINKQIKAMRRDSKSPERSRTKSPKDDKPTAMRRDSISSERSRSKSPKYNKLMESRRREKVAKTKRNYYRAIDNTVFFRYLPTSVKLPDLREKMCEIGRLVEARLLGKGNATVSFRNRRDAESCIELYNMAKVDGQTIEVKWSNK